jgi:3-oxoacyl-[acyl-carrier protein] reductase
MAETFEGKVVLITGAGGRIGLGLAQTFHAAGAKVALGDLRQDAVDRLAADLSGERTFAGVVDVRDAASVQSFFAATEQDLGPVDIAVANAGVFPTRAVLDLDVAEWDRVIEINMRGTFLTARRRREAWWPASGPGRSLRSLRARMPARGPVAPRTVPRRPA